jgi:hypothetical protein
MGTQREGDGDSTQRAYAREGRFGESGARGEEDERASGSAVVPLALERVCFSMRPVDAYWCHFSAKSVVISTNGSLRSESRLAKVNAELRG